MALNGRGVLDPRFAFFARPVVRGAMLAVGVLYRPDPTRLLEDDWQPFADDPFARAPKATSSFLPIFQGPCRVQPNQDWRARKVSARSEIVVEHATRVQIDFRQNQLLDLGGEPSPAIPEVRVNDVFRVTEVLTVDGVEVDPELTRLPHIVMNIVPSSNSWVRTILCSTDMTKVGVPT